MIYIDASRYSNTEKRTGVENYSYFLIRELATLAPADLTLISPRRVKLSLPQIVIPFPRLWTQLRLSFEIFRNTAIETLFVPSHVMPFFHPKKTVVTIHDVAFKRFPESYGFFSRLYLNFGADLAVQTAARIITPSETTKRDLMTFYGCPESKITAIPLGFEKPTEEPPTETLKLLGLKPQNYFLYIGRLETKKNTDNLIKAFALFAKENSEFKLVLAGFPGRGGKAILNAIPSDLKNRILIPGYISEADKWMLLKNTNAFVFPSRYEGFGLPILEAMQANVPLICSDIPSSKEIIQEGPLFFEPEDAVALAGHLKTMATDPGKRRQSIQSYPDILKKYTWKACAESTLKVLQAA